MVFCPEEKILERIIFLNVEIKSRHLESSQTDHLKDTINYAEINKIIHEEIAHKFRVVS